MSIIGQIIGFLEILSFKVPVLVFVFIGGLLEEIVAPIPSPLVMSATGTLINTQQKGILFLLLAGLVGSVAKTIGCWFWYFLADKGEDFILTRFGKYIGFSHNEVESIGKHFKNNENDFLILLLTRAIPLMPTTPVSVVAGIIKIDMKKYLLASFAGNFIRNMMFLYIGYVGGEAYKDLLNGLNNIESLVQILIGLALVAFVGYIYWKRNKTSDPIQDFINKFLKKK